MEMHRARIVLLAPTLCLLWGCPVEVPASRELSFLCNHDDECGRGHSCDQARHVCVPSSSIEDASVLDAARDGGGADVPGDGGASVDVSRADVAYPDGVAADGVMGDVEAADVEAADAEAADSASSDVTSADQGAPDSAAPDSAPSDTSPFNNPPVITAPATSQLAYPSGRGPSYPAVIQVEVADVEGDVPFSLSLVEGDAGCSISGTELHYTPAPETYDISVQCTVTATDSGSPPATSAQVSFTIDVVHPYVSCYWIAADAELAASGIGADDDLYLIDPDGPDGAIAPYDASCGMSFEGGGWTLALRARNADNYVYYDSSIWTGPDDYLSVAPAPIYGASEKYRPFNDLAFSELLIGMVEEGAAQLSSGTPALNYLQRDLRAAPLLDVFRANRQTSTPWSARDRSAWLALLPGATLQAHCNREGLNAYEGGGRRIRIGISSNEQEECYSNDSHIGVGADNTCGDGAYVGSSSCSGAEGGDVAIAAFALVWVRDSQIVSQRQRRTCTEHRLAGETARGLYRIDFDGDGGWWPLLTYCDMELLGGGWTLVATNGNDGHFGYWEASFDEWYFGVPALEEDYKSPAYHHLAIHDVLFHREASDDEWVYYQDFGEGGLSVGRRFSDMRNPDCPLYAARGFHASAHDLRDSELCDRTLYVSPADMDGTRDYCGYDEDVAGPAWSVDRGQGCPLDNPDGSSFTYASGDSPFGDNPVQIWVRETDFRGLGAAPSCQAHRDLGRAMSGTYVIEFADQDRDRYCLMNDDSGGQGWMRIADIDRAHGDGCRGGWEAHSTPLACYRNRSAGGSRSTSFPVFGFEYQQVRGYVRGYQQGSTNGFDPDPEAIDDMYVDGISITHGAPGGRTHIWTYAFAHDEDQGQADSCPCRGGEAPPAFVGDDYYCDTARETDAAIGVWYTDNELFDDISPSACYTGGDPAWFEKLLAQPTSEDINVRLMADEGSSNEEPGLTRIELYVR